MSLAHAKDLNNREDNNRREDHHREDHNSREDTSEDHKTGRNREKEMTGSSIVRAIASIIKLFVNNKIKKNKRKIKQTCEDFNLQSMTAVEDDNARNAALEQQLLGMLNSSGSCSDVTFGCLAVNHVPASPDQLCREINTNARTVSSAS